MPILRSCALLAVVVAGALAAACGGSPQARQTPAGANSNSADVTFAQQMIPHHDQAIQMAKLAATNAHDPSVKQLAANIEAAQGPEIKTMMVWLHSWGQPTPSAAPGMMSPMPGASQMPMPGMHQAPGMMSAREMSRMASMHGAAFDSMFLTMMIRHHQGAVDMARTEQAHGANPDAKHLARQIEASQSAQISEMQQMLNTMAGTH